MRLADPSFSNRLNYAVVQNESQINQKSSGLSFGLNSNKMIDTGRRVPYDLDNLSKITKINYVPPGTGSYTNNCSSTLFSSFFKKVASYIEKI